MKRINRISLILPGLCFLAALLIMATGGGLTDGSFGPAAYYYTDIPGWQERFYGPGSLQVMGSDETLIPILILSILLAALFFYSLIRISRNGVKR